MLGNVHPNVYDKLNLFLQHLGPERIGDFLQTTKEAAEANLILQTYPFPKVLIEKTEQVITALTTTVTPDQWGAQGGRSTVVAVENVLVVSGSDSVHLGVTDFLRKLDDAFERYAARQKSELAGQQP